MMSSKSKIKVLSDGIKFILGKLPPTPHFIPSSAASHVDLICQNNNNALIDNFASSILMIG
jgi:hypothetical protein